MQPLFRVWHGHRPWELTGRWRKTSNVLSTSSIHINTLSRDLVCKHIVLSLIAGAKARHFDPALLSNNSFCGAEKAKTHIQQSVSVKFNIRGCKVNSADSANARRAFRTQFALLRAFTAQMIRQWRIKHKKRLSYK